MTPLLRLASLHPLRPRASVRGVLDARACLAYAAAIALAVSLLAGVRAGVIEGRAFHPARFASSLFGFVALPALLAWVGRWLGGRSSVRALAVAVAGSAVPFLAVDALWIGLADVALENEPLRWALVGFERLSWIWALALLVAGVAEAQRFSAPRALANVLLAFAAAATAAVAFAALR